MSAQTAVGWDIHRKFSQLSAVQRNEHAEIRVAKRMRLEHADRQATRAELTKLAPGTPVAMEGAFGWPWIADLLQELGLDPHLGHPPAIKILAKNEPQKPIASMPTAWAASGSEASSRKVICPHRRFATCGSGCGIARPWSISAAE